MAVAETARLVVDLSLKGNFARQLKGTERALGKFDARLENTESRAYRAGQQIGTGIKRAAAIGAVGVGLLALNVQRGLESLIELEQQQAQTNAVIKSTGGIAGVTAEEVGRLAEKYEGLNATVGDEVIREGQNLLLTFTNIRKEAFEPALAVALDMNTALGKGPDGLTSTVRILGKALNDPTKGLAALNRVGITFTKEQADRIKGLQKEGDLLGAQTIILDELNKRFEGSFIAQGGTTAGKVAKFNDAIEDLQRSLAAGLLPVVSNIADALTDLFQDPAIQSGIKTFGEDLGKLLSPQNIKEGIRQLRDLAGVIAPAFQAAATAIGAVVGAFSKLPPDLRNLLIGAFAVNKLTGGLLTNVAGGIFSALKLMTVQAGVVNVSGGVVNGGGGIGGAAGGAAGIGLGAAVGLGALVAGFQVAVTQATNKTFGTQLKAAGMYDLPGLLHNLGEVVKLGDQVLNQKSDIQIAAQQRQAAEALLAQRKTEQGIDKSKTTLAAKAQETTRETTRGAAQVQATTKAATASSAAVIAATQVSTAGAIINAIFAARPVISVTNVTRTYNRTTNYGPTSSSKNKNAADSNYGPN